MALTRGNEERMMVAREMSSDSFAHKTSEPMQSYESNALSTDSTVQNDDAVSSGQRSTEVETEGVDVAEEPAQIPQVPLEDDQVHANLPFSRAKAMLSPTRNDLRFPSIEGEEGENAEPTGFRRAHSPTKLSSSGGIDTFGDSREHQLHQMHKFSLYETLTRFYLIGSDVLDAQFRILKIDRTAPPGQIAIVEDETVYSKKEINQLLNTIEDGNRAVGGMRYRGTSWGLLGFIRFTEAYYMLLITKKVQVATIGGHYIFQIADTDLIPLTTGSTSNFRSNRNAEESRFLSILGNLDLNQHFYFSYSYNVTRTLQHNIITSRQTHAENVDEDAGPDHNDMFLWNHHLLQPAIKALKNPFDWCMPIIHGFVDQAGEIKSNPVPFINIANSSQRSTCMDEESMLPLLPAGRVSLLVRGF